ncbi:MAG: hypothetical protein MJ231_07105 [bacterium]|nr:hypothetical protein [bacterium]
MNITTSNNDLIFQAKLVTHLKGRNNAMAKLRPVFEQVSKNVKGELEIARDPHTYNKIFATADGMSMYVGDGLHKFLSLENPTKEEITEIAKKALNTLKLLQAEAMYHNKETEICQAVSKDLYRCKKGKRIALQDKNDILADMYQKNIDKLISKRNEKIRKIQEPYFKKLDKYSPKSLEPNHGKYVKDDVIKV